MTDAGMEVLFVCSVAKTGECSNAVREQARCLKEAGFRISFFGVDKRGVTGYLKAIFLLRRLLHRRSFDVVHAHYGLCGMVASLACARPLVVSLMGSDVLGSLWLRWMVGFFAAWIWPEVVVKSVEMANAPGLSNAKVIPNGVDISLFREIPREQARKKSGVQKGKVVLWPAAPDREVKDYELAVRVMEKLKRQDCHLLAVEKVPFCDMPFYFNSADVVLVTSRHEGSPNVVKEALACNVPVVSTQVGDAEHWLGGIDGCCLCDPDPVSLAKGLEKAFRSNGRCQGRSRVEEVSADKITKKLITLYRNQIGKGRKIPAKGRSELKSIGESHGIEDRNI